MCDRLTQVLTARQWEMLSGPLPFQVTPSCYSLQTPEAQRTRSSVYPPRGALPPRFDLPPGPSEKHGVLGVRLTLPLLASQVS